MPNDVTTIDKSTNNWVKSDDFKLANNHMTTQYHRYLSYHPISDENSRLTFSYEGDDYIKNSDLNADMIFYSDQTTLDNLIKLCDEVSLLNYLKYEDKRILLHSNDRATVNLFLDTISKVHAIHPNDMREVYTLLTKPSNTVTTSIMRDHIKEKLNSSSMFHRARALLERSQLKNGLEMEYYKAY